MVKATVTVTYQTAHDAGNGAIDFDHGKIEKTELHLLNVADARKAAQTYGSMIGEWKSIYPEYVAIEDDPTQGGLIAVIGVGIEFTETDTDWMCINAGLADEDDQHLHANYEALMSEGRM